MLIRVYLLLPLLTRVQLCLTLYLCLLTCLLTYVYKGLTFFARACLPIFSHVNTFLPMFTHVYRC